MSSIINVGVKSDFRRIINTLMALSLIVVLLMTSFGRCFMFIIRIGLLAVSFPNLIYYVLVGEIDFLRINSFLFL